MTFKEFFLFESDRIGLSKIDPNNPNFTTWGGRIVRSLQGREPAVVGFWKIWADDGPSYSTRIDFPDSTHQGPTARTREELYPWVEKALNVKGYDTSTFKEARSSMVYHGWPDEEVMTSQPEYNPELHFISADFFNKLIGVKNQAQYQINNPDEFNTEKTFYHATTREHVGSLLKSGFDGTAPHRNHPEEFYKGSRANMLFMFDNLEDAVAYGHNKQNLTIIKIVIGPNDPQPIEDREALGRSYMVNRVHPKQMSIVPDQDLDTYKESANQNIILDLSGYRHGITKEAHNLAVWSRENETDKEPWTEEDVKEFVEDLVKESEENIRKNIYPVIEAAVSRIPNYKGSQFTISCNAVYDRLTKSYDLAPIEGDSAYINVGTGKNGLLVLKHENGKIEVDDILEMGEEEPEFFTNDNERSDYYGLIKALQNAGRPARIVTLYTARPKKDRELYRNAKYLPANIFLTNSYSHAMGLAIDLSDGDEVRDVYRVRIEDTNLITTLDGPVSYYQLSAPTEIKSISMM